MNIYPSLLRPLFFQLDAETAHNLALRLLAVSPVPVLRMLFGARVPVAPTDAFGLRFANPVGLAAGMDKHAEALPAWEALGFGFAEIGTVTSLAQPGNPKPRAFRYPKHQALVNRMGFNNPGAKAVADRLARLRASGRWPRIPIGINLGKSKLTPVEEATSDYLASLRLLRDHGDYFVINVSSPNTPGLRDLQEISRLRLIASSLRSEMPEKPLLIKIAPDLPIEAALEIANLAGVLGLDGLIATNTTLDHSALPPELDEQGGLSGKPLQELSTQMVQALTQASALPVIASGGIMDAASANEKLAAGARLVQIYTGFIYQGPQLIRDIVRSRC